MKHTHQTSRHIHNRTTAGKLCHFAPPLNPQVQCGEAFELLLSLRDLPCLPVINDEGEVIGIASRNYLLITFANPNVHALYQWKPITRLMDPSPMVVDASLDNDAVLGKMTAGNTNAFIDGFVVLRNGIYAGVASTLDLMKSVLSQGRERIAVINTSRYAAERTLSQLKETQQDLIQAEKMAALGQLVAGIAHEINTPVGVSLTGASFLSEQTQEVLDKFQAGELRKGELETFLNHCDETGKLLLTNLNRAGDLIRSFKEVAVDQASAERRSFSLCTYLREILLSLQPKIRTSAQTVTLECPENLAVNSYPGALFQIITNFVVNALTHAFEPDQNGEIFLTAVPDEKNSVMIIVADNGLGIPEHHQKKIFEPFFTTRRGSGGSGLGLHIVYNLVTQTLDGSLSVESEVGIGTAFIISFPRNPSKQVQNKGAVEKEDREDARAAGLMG